MKVAPIHRAMRASDGFDPLLVHTGQHYDAAMSKVFFDALALDEPDVYLDVGSGTHAEQTARVMIAFERTCLDRKPDLVLVVGDVNSTLACSLVASKLQIPVAHVEAGLRSGDRTMPEEINRMLTDAVSDYLFTSCDDADENLSKEGIRPDTVHFVGNVMIDSLLAHLDQATAVYRRSYADRFRPGSFGLVTLHRPSNVDAIPQLSSLVAVLRSLAERLPLVFPVHPRTRARLEDCGLKTGDRVALTEPLGYLPFVGLMRHAGLVMTDSGGIQEETSVLDVPCVTLRANTERPITIRLGSNVLAGTDPERVLDACLKQLDAPKRSRSIPLWDGRTAGRIVEALARATLGRAVAVPQSAPISPRGT